MMESPVQPNRARHLRMTKIVMVRCEAKRSPEPVMVRCEAKRSPEP